MMLITMAIALPLARTQRFTSLHGVLRVSSGLLSLAFGLSLAYRIGVVEGLFGAHPIWTPE